MSKKRVPTTPEVAEAWLELRKREEPDGVWNPDGVYHAEFQRFLARVKADAWDEGSVAYGDAEYMDASIISNPYKK